MTSTSTPRPSVLAFGHNGSYGTVMWADPATGLSVALFTAEPSFTEVRKTPSWPRSWTNSSLL
jgi:CubicO group peptidase (beta-lactamase class C family)